MWKKKDWNKSKLSVRHLHNIRENFYNHEFVTSGGYKQRYRTLIAGNIRLLRAKKYKLQVTLHNAPLRMLARKLNLTTA